MKKVKKPAKAKSPKISKLPDNVRHAIEAKQSQESGWESGKGSGQKNTGFSGGSAKRTGGRDR
jgi:hypothetical protein